ncbi:uncharacterized protein [Dermacentor andersoni]|uniref:uncharacterized protein isoform X1 n=1 Tax=Dermacentor andersoni TaxID=34620 RepID=UPI003B3A187C
MCATSAKFAGEDAAARLRLFSVGLVAVAFLFCFAAAAPDHETPGGSCPNGRLTFELVTGYVYSAPSDTIELKPGTLQLTDCLEHCRRNASCQSVNFETGLCVLFTSSATERPASLAVSQFPVFTLYAQKICLFGKRRCSRDWAFERVTGYALRDLARKRLHAVAREECMDMCLDETEFQCRSANFDPSTGECAISDMDRHSVVGDRYFVPSGETNEYLESNCVDESVRLCEFRTVSGKILKTVDAVFQNVTTLEECRRLCLSVPYRCHSFDLGDPENSVCRISHHARASLSHIENPYLEIPGAATNELAACYNVTIQCKAREMVAMVKTSKIFNGKVYAKARPNSCVTDVVNSLDFQIRMAYHELDCDVKQEVSQSLGQFSTDIVIQHHDMIVTNQDLGLSVHCQYDLANRSVSNGVQLEVDGREVETSQSQLATVSSPNVTMRITDRQGDDVFTAQVGDSLALRFEIVDSNSPYEIFVRELVAMDGVDSSEILLVDSHGCPTDRTIMGPLHKVNDDGKVLHAPFDAFKFPTSEIVQFKALVTPCLPTCEAARCSEKSQTPYGREVDSFGRRRRRWTEQGAPGENGVWRRPRRSSSPAAGDDEDDELVVVQTIHITDKFGFARSQQRDGENGADGSSKDTMMLPTDGSSCINVVGLIVACSMFLMAQVVLLLVWGCVWQRRRRNKLDEYNTPSIDILYSSSRESSVRYARDGSTSRQAAGSAAFNSIFNGPCRHLQSRR